MPLLKIQIDYINVDIHNTDNLYITLKLNNAHYNSQQ